MNRIRPNNLLATLVKANESALFANLIEFNAEKHTRLHLAGEQIEHVYFPLSGMISLLTVMSDGTAVETSAVGFDSASGFNGALIPHLIDQNPCAHWRSPMDMIFQGRSTSVFQA